MVGAGVGVTLIPEMAVPVETRSAPVAVARFADLQPTRTVGMIWRKTSPLASQLGRIAEIVRRAGTWPHGGPAAEAAPPRSDPATPASPDG